MGSIDYRAVELFLAACRHKGLGPKVVRECLSVLSLILKFAVKATALSENPAAGHGVVVRRKKLREGDGVLSMEQVHQLVAYVPERYKPAVWLLVFAGLRPAELCGLRVRDIDFARHEVSVRATLMPVHRYGDQPYRGRVEGPPKTDAGDRTIPIPECLCHDLAAVVATRGTLDRDAFLFQTRFLYGRACQDPFWPGSKVLGFVGRFGPVGDGGRGAQRFLGPRRAKCRR